MNAVLKDMKNRPAGYIRESDGRTVCRVSLREPAQLMLVCVDGTQMIWEMQPGDTERLFACDGIKLRYACVFRDDTLLYATDAAAKEAFRETRRMLQRARVVEEGKEENRTRDEERQSRLEAPETDTETDMETEKEIKETRAIREWPHRRWPPPDWTNACYLDGRWIEYSEEWETLEKQS